ITLFMLTLAMFNVLFAKLSGQEDIILGTPTAGRRHADFQRIIGIFINTLIMRNYPAGEKKFDRFLQEVKAATLSAFENQDCQFEDLVESDGIEIKRDTGRNPLFDVMFIFQNVQMPEIEMSDLTLKPYGEAQDVSKFDMTIELAENDDGLFIMIEYCTRIFKKQTIERFMVYFNNIASSIIADTGQSISQIPMIPQEEKNRLLYEFNDTAREYPTEKTIHQLIEEQAERTPNGTALTAKNPDAYSKGTPLVQLTYSELNRQAQALATRLKKEGVSANTIVAIMVERSLEMIIGILGILKAGGAYLPVDTGFPKNRIDFMLKDSGTKIIVSNGLIVKKLNGSNQPTNEPANLAYVIYTSGSTGRPKGVMLRHREVHNFITGITGIIDFPARSTILALTTISFDIFVLETLLPLSRGLKVVVANEDQQQDSQLLSQLILDQGINLLQATPSRMQLLIQGSGKDSLACLERLNTIMIGGEAFPLQLLKELKSLTSARIYNMYGPTETTVWSTVKELTNTNHITVGRPIANTSIYILDSHLNPQPLNVAGDLWIGGDGLAAGYLNRPEMTNDRFQTVKTKLYNTGDMARWLPDGNIEFIGRIDNQVKIRGFRVELGEIESQLLT
ncbi:MAG: amino acid adenylation domain-containing protein, partial [bacterium]|nr:amino acid adenylation domain-containing protein [bacterium]